MQHTELMVLSPLNMYEISMKTGISQEELELRYMTARENDSIVFYTITTTVASRTEKGDRGE